MNNIYRWLHISDLHCYLDPNQTQMKAAFISKVSALLQDKPINSIIITGDFFNKGTFAFGPLKQFLEDVYYVCSERCGWRWERGTKMTRCFFCPGNHDLNRNVSWHKKNVDFSSDTLPQIFSRNVVLTDTVKNHPDQFPNSSLLKYKVLTEESFWQFYNAMERLCGYPDPDSKHKNECNVFLANDDTIDPIFFVGLNTELYAGQIRSSDEILKDISAAYSAYSDSHNRLDFDTATREYSRYTNFMRELGNNIAKDDGKLCFISSNAKSYIEQYIHTNSFGKDPLIIKFGHRGIDSLTDVAQQHLADFLHDEKSLSELYLCGHGHKPGAKRKLIQFLNGNPIHIIESTVGGIFADDSNYNSCSFMMGEILWEQPDHDDFADTSVSLNQTLYLWVKRYSPDCIQNYENTPSNKPYVWESISLERAILRVNRCQRTDDPNARKEDNAQSTPASKKQNDGSTNVQKDQSRLNSSPESDDGMSPQFDQNSIINSVSSLNHSVSYDPLENFNLLDF